MIHINLLPDANLERDNGLIQPQDYIRLLGESSELIRAVDHSIMSEMKSTN